MSVYANNCRQLVPAVWYLVGSFSCPGPGQGRATGPQPEDEIRPLFINGLPMVDSPVPCKSPFIQIEMNTIMAVPHLTYRPSTYPPSSASHSRAGQTRLRGELLVPVQICPPVILKLRSKDGGQFPSVSRGRGKLLPTFISPSINVLVPPQRITLAPAPAATLLELDSTPIKPFAMSQSFRRPYKNNRFLLRRNCRSC